MTRVDKINKAIFYMFINKEMSAREIQRKLLDNDIELALVEILNIIAEFNYKPVKPRRKSKTEALREEFRPILYPIVKIASVYGINNKLLVEYLNYFNINYPSNNNKKFTACKLDSLLNDYNYGFPKKRKKLNLTLEELFQLINSNLTEEQLIILENWKRKC